MAAAVCVVDQNPMMMDDNFWAREGCHSFALIMVSIWRTRLASHAITIHRQHRIELRSSGTQTIGQRTSNSCPHSPINIHWLNHRLWLTHRRQQFVFSSLWIFLNKEDTLFNISVQQRVTEWGWRQWIDDVGGNKKLFLMSRELLINRSGNKTKFLPLKTTWILVFSLLQYHMGACVCVCLQDFYRFAMQIRPSCNFRSRR